MAHDDLVGAGISPRERLERIEAMLDRIDGKLDSKADAAHVVAIDMRLHTVEKHLAEHLVGGHAQVTEAVELLHSQHEQLARRVSYAAGAAAAALLVADIGLRFIL